MAILNDKFFFMLLYSMHISCVICVDWNGVRYSVFNVLNGIISRNPRYYSAFKLSINLLNITTNAQFKLGVGCYIRLCQRYRFDGAHAYANAMRNG